MNVQLQYLTWVVVLTGLMWVPYVLDRFAVWGVASTVSYPPSPPPQSPWAVRLMKAHYNAIENLAIFATLVLVAEAADLHNETTAAACMAYFWARLVHALAYTFKVPWVRTLAFVVGFCAQAAIAWQLLLAST